MPRKKDVMPPTAKRTEGAIYSFEMRDAHNAAVALAKKEAAKLKKIRYSRFVDGIEIVSYHQPVKH